MSPSRILGKVSFTADISAMDATVSDRLIVEAGPSDTVFSSAYVGMQIPAESIAIPTWRWLCNPMFGLDVTSALDWRASRDHYCDGEVDMPLLLLGTTCSSANTSTNA